jgi:flagellar protein FlaI
MPFNWKIKKYEVGFVAFRRKSEPGAGTEGVEMEMPRGKKAQVGRRKTLKAKKATFLESLPFWNLWVDTELAGLQQKMSEAEEKELIAVERKAAKIPRVREVKIKKSKGKKVLARLGKPSAKSESIAARIARIRSVKVEKPTLERLEAEPELTELQRRIARGEAESLRRFEEHTTFVCPEGYQEVERYWITEPYSWVAILFNPEKNERMYYLVEPSLTPSEKTILEMLHEHLLDRLTYEEGTKDRDAVIVDKVNELLDEYEISIDEETVKKLLYYLKRSYIGYGRIDAFLKDPKIEDISCDGLGLPIFLYHQDYQNIRTNIVYEDPIELDLFVGRLVERAGKQISLGKPTVDATLPQGYRLQATIGKEVTTRGSTFTIRKYRERPFTPVDLIKYKTFSSEMLAYLWLAAENKRNIMIVGGTASGKTCTLNAIALFMPPDAKIVSIEDTRELSLYQENWVAAVTRPAYGGKAITMYDLLAQALRQRPEIIIVGEVRGPEALSLFQAMTTGHTSYSTMHAGSIQEMIYRLEGEPINVPHHMLAALDIVCIQLLTYFKDKRVRRNQSILEIAGIDQETGALKTNRLFERDPVTDQFEKLGDSIVLNEIMQERGWSALRLKTELENRRKVLEYLVEKDISGIEDVSKIIRQYFFEPEKVMKQVGLKK